ncbi:hypothetical protein, partial [Xanthomonas populi]|uniref:hypothetical protein n=1 Tax=Xanthomonas populi TaxID=53414 RepID=UPI001ABF7E54
IADFLKVWSSSSACHHGYDLVVRGALYLNGAIVEAADKCRHGCALIASSCLAAGALRDDGRLSLQPPI